MGFLMNCYHVRCATKKGTGNFKNVTHLGGIDGNGEKWYEPVAVVIRSISNGHVFYITEDGRRKILKVIHDAEMHPYLMVFADGLLMDSLSVLEECEINES